MKPPKTRLEIGFLNGEPEKAFFDEVHRILLGPYRSADPPAIADRRRLMEFIALTLTYLKKMGAGDRFTDKLTACYAALRDLDRGVTHPILKARGTRKPPLSSEIWRLRAVLAVALDYLMRAGESLEDAATTVARTPGIGRLLSGRALSAEARKRAQKSDARRSVIRWRNTLRRGKKTSEIARLVWEASRETLTTIRGPKEFRKEAAKLIGRARRELVH